MEPDAAKLLEDVLEERLVEGVRPLGDLDDDALRREPLLPDEALESPFEKFAIGRRRGREVEEEELVLPDPAGLLEDAPPADAFEREKQVGALGEREERLPGLESAARGTPGEGFECEIGRASCRERV